MQFGPSHEVSYDKFFVSAVLYVQVDSHFLTRHRRCIYTTKADFQFFRQLSVNLVIATDLMDSDASKSRAKRWDKAFSKSILGAGRNTNGSQNDAKATLVLESLIQAADIAHTLQHFNVYR